MHTLQQPFLSKLTQVAANRVFGEVKVLRQSFSDHLTLFSQNLQDVLLALLGQHDLSLYDYTNVLDTARNYTHNDLMRVSR